MATTSFPWRNHGMCGEVICEDFLESIVILNAEDITIEDVFVRKIEGSIADYICRGD